MRTTLRNLAPAQLGGIGLQLLSERGLHLRGQAEVGANRIEGTNLGKQLLQLHAQALAARGHHLRHQQAGQHAIFLRNVAADGQPRRLLAADGDLVLVNQLADVLEAHRRLVERNLVIFRQGID